MQINSIISTEDNSNINSNSNSNINSDNTLYELNEIKKLSTNIEKIFSTSVLNNFSTSFEFNYDFKNEYSNGHIEYKRTLSSYANTKIDKLIRQIYWRIYEGSVINNIKICYYIIGLEDSGLPSNISKEELENSINIMSDTLANTELIFSYLFLHNTIKNYNFIIVKIWLENDNNNDMTNYWI